MAQGFVYVVMAPLSWAEPKIKFRRHRLAEYLKKKKDTVEVIWIYPVSATPRIPGSYIKAMKEIRDNFCISVNEGGIKECALPDFIPGRYMQFKSAFGNLNLNKLKKILNSYDAKKILWFTYPLYPYLTGLLNWDLIIYDCSDLWIAPSGGSKSNTFSSKTVEGLIYSAEKRIIHHSDIIFASSDFLTERIKKITGRQAITIENGVDFFYFQNKKCQEKDVLDKIPGPRLGYVGALRSKIDYELLEELANYNPDWSIVLVGPDCLNKRGAFERLLQKDNVFWTGEVKSEEVPHYISALDLGLLPYREIEYNKAVFPIKFYEYLSQGIPVVGCGIPSTEKYCQKGVYRHVGRDKFQEACLETISSLTGDNAPYIKKRIQLAQEANWDTKLAEMLNKVKERL